MYYSICVTLQIHTIEYILCTVWTIISELLTHSNSRVRHNLKKDTDNYLEERGVVLRNKNIMQSRCPIFATFGLDNTILHDRPTLKFPSPNDSLRLLLLSVVICLKSVNVSPCAINLQHMTHKPVSGEIFSLNRLSFLGRIYASKRLTVINDD